MNTTTTHRAEQDPAKAALIQALKTAWKRGEQPEAERDADLTNANLRSAHLQDADLRGVDLWGADLRNANLRGADLSDARLRGADLRNADLTGADLRFTDLRFANLLGTRLLDANLRGVGGTVLQVTGLHPYQATVVPTVEGWWVRIGCWQGTTKDLRTLSAKDDGWPSARGHQIEARRPLLNVLADMCDLHATNNKDALDDVMARWGEKKEG